MQDTSSKQQGNKNTNQSSPDRITTSLSLAHQGKNKQTKNSAQISPYTKLTQTTEPTLGGQKPKGRKNSTLKAAKGDLKHNVKKYIHIMKSQRNTTQMKEQIRNTEVQINEEKLQANYPKKNSE